jgi:hypothetical protein
VADDEARPHRILAAHDVQVGAADRRQGDANDDLTGARVRQRYGLEANVALAMKDGRAHRLRRDHGSGIDWFVHDVLLNRRGGC